MAEDSVTLSGLWHAGASGFGEDVAVSAVLGVSAGVDVCFSTGLDAVADVAGAGSGSGVGSGVNVSVVADVSVTTTTAAASRFFNFILLLRVFSCHVLSVIIPVNSRPLAVPRRRAENSSSA